MNAAIVKIEAYQSLFASLNDAVYAVDRDGRILFANAAMERLSGYAVRELHGRPSVVLYTPADRPVFLERRARALRGEAVPPLLEATLVRRDNRQVPVELSMANLMLDGQIVGRIAVVRDLTDRKRLEAALREHLTRLQAILAYTTAVIYIMGANDGFRLINRRFAQLFGVTNDEVAGQPLEAVFAPQVAAAFRANNHAVRESRTPLEFEELVLQDDGLHTYLSVKVPLYGPDGAPDAICGISTDITERKRAEAALQAALQAKEVLLQEVHHRIKNNLQVVSSLLDLQADALADPRALAALEDSQRRIQAMALIHESLYRADDLAHVNAADYVRQLCTRLLQASQPSGDRITLTLELEAVALEMSIAIPCGLILNELLSNALKHAFPAGRAGDVTVGLRRGPEGQVQLMVRDTGVGVPEGLDVRATPSLGWQLVGLLTEQLGGTMALGRRGGTTVTVTFPLTGRG